MEKSVDIILSNTYFSSFEHIVDKALELSSKDKFANIILLVPDKFSLNAEQFLLEKSKKSAVFNIWVATLSRLVNKVVEDKVQNMPILSKNSGTMLVAEIILKNADKISAYKRLTKNYKLAETMFNAINLLKSSGIRPEELKNNFAETNFGLKIQDIYLVYSEYEKALNGRADQITRLKIFDQLVKSNDYIKSADIFVGYFDSFTNAQLSSIACLAKNAKSFSIGLCANTLQKNANIYDNVVFQRIKNKFDEQFVDCKITNVVANLPKWQNHIAQNMFSFETVSQQETGNIFLTQCQNIDDEVRTVANEIKYLLLEKNYTFDDINIAICGLNDYKTKLVDIFDEYDYSFYVDLERDITSHYFVRTILKIFDFICDGNTLPNALAIAKSPLFDFSSDQKDCFENYCTKHNIFGEMLFSPFDFEGSPDEKSAECVRTIFDGIKDFAGQIENCKTVAQYVDCIEQYLTKIEAKQKIENFSQCQFDIVQKQLDGQVFDKFSNVLKEASSLLGDDQMSKQFFFDMLKSDLKSVNLLTVPLKCNSIFVGDTSKSTFYPRKILFVLGASQGKMPTYQSDYGTITDAEIANFRAMEHITPTIKELNKREKFKIFNLLLSAKEQLHLSFSLMNNGETLSKSEFVTELQRLFCSGGKSLTVKNADDIPLELVGSEDLVAYFVGTKLNAIKLASQNDKQNAFVKDVIFDNMAEELDKINGKLIESDQRFIISNPQNAIFANGETSASQIEKYFKCPFFQFLKNAIRPQDKQKYELQKFEIGTLLHSLAQNFVIKIQKDPNLDAVNVSKQLLQELLEKKEYSKINDDPVMKQNLIEESKRFCLAIKNQFDVGNYKPTFAEKHFAGYVLPSGIKIRGVPDRVDVCKSDNSLRIIDYKTGSEVFEFADVFYGKKVQLVLYLKVMSDLLGKKPVGAFYMPVKNRFGESADFLEQYKLDGIVIDDPYVLQNFDFATTQTPPSSSVLDIYKKGQKSLAPQKTKNVLTQKQLLQIEDYVMQIVNNATVEMQQGFIEPKPNDVACQYCQFGAICHFDVEQKGCRKFDTISKNSFSSEEGDQSEN